jgi:competence protein ComK
MNNFVTISKKQNFDKNTWYDRVNITITGKLRQLYRGLFHKYRGVEILESKLIEMYEVNPFTMFIQPEEYGRKVYSKIVELEDDFISPYKPTDLIKRSCEFFGSTLEGRQKGSSLLMGITHKVPIAIDPSNFIYFFPTTSPVRAECIWISHEHVISHRRYSPGQTLVTFQNKESYLFPISYSSFENQLLRTALLKTKLMQRMEHMERKTFYLHHRPKFMEASEAERKYGSNTIL